VALKTYSSGPRGGLEGTRALAEAYGLPNVLMIDVGGSMHPYTELMSQLFSATKKATHFKELRTYYFHNCVYGEVYGTTAFAEPTPVVDLMRQCASHYKLIMVGDASMAPYELHMGGHWSAGGPDEVVGIGLVLVVVGDAGAVGAVELPA